MAFLVKYMAFFGAFLSATQLASSTDVKIIDASDPKSAKDYLSMVEENDCHAFDPFDTSLIDASALDAATLYQLFVLRSSGSLIEYCVPKAGEDRILVSFFVGIASSLVSSWILG